VAHGSTTPAAVAASIAVAADAVRQGVVARITAAMDPARQRVAADVLPLVEEPA
jgi:fatty acid/phospholipid biosynthesis enzyme